MKASKDGLLDFNGADIKTANSSLDSKSYYEFKVLGRIALAYNFGPSYS